MSATWKTNMATKFIKDQLARQHTAARYSSQPPRLQPVLEALKVHCYTGIRGKPLGGFPPNPLSLVLTRGEPTSGSHDAERLSLSDSIPIFQLLNSTMVVRQ